MTSFASIPQEVLEHIAFFSATQTFLGPPNGIASLLGLNRSLHSALSPTTNPHLYARIFAYKFDLSSATRRLGADALPAIALAEELQRRSRVLNRLRRRLDSKIGSPPQILDELLWTAYLMLLESDGKNEQQLCEYAHINTWLKEFWFDPHGASGAMSTVKHADEWPENSERTSLALWLFWFTLRPVEYVQDDVLFRDATGLLKVIALGAHRYPSCYPDWQEYVPRDFRPLPTTVRHFSSNLRVVAPAPASPAILAYLTLVNKLTVSWESATHLKPLFPPIDIDIPSRTSSEWDGDWARILSLSNPKLMRSGRPSGSFTPGSLEGVWEGIFTYTEFTSYAALLSGAPPSVLQRSLVAQHRQTIKLREWHLTDDDSIPMESQRPARPLSAGNPCRAYVPDNIRITNKGSTLELIDPETMEPLVYHPWSILKRSEMKSQVRDIFLTGEGHSAWGQFSLIGRIRPCDGFISLSKEYTDGDRGKWLYRAYMVGNAHGHLAGRWRDTLSPPHIQGYEGTWVASRRR